MTKCLQYPLDLLNNDQLIAIVISRILFNDDFSNYKIESRVLTVSSSQNDNNGEIQTLMALNKILKSWKPFFIIGFAIKCYDIPFLSLKYQKLKELWFEPTAIRMSLENAIIIDLESLIFNQLQYEERSNHSINFLSFRDALSHPLFQEIPLDLRYSSAEYRSLSVSEEKQMLYQWWLHKKLGKLKDYLKSWSYNELIAMLYIFDQQ